MRIIPFLICACCTVALIIVFNSTLLLPAALGKILSPQHGIWQNAEPADGNFNAELNFPSLKGKSDVYFDERLVPHVFAEYDDDAYFIQGYLHAKFRLWQMEFQTHAAAGRLCEVLGDKVGSTDLLNAADRQFRRLGMGYAAEIAVKEIEKDSLTKMVANRYTAGVNAYIASLTESSMPVEYKIMGYKPEPWSNLKTALFLKYMSYDLAGHEDDFENTNLLSAFGINDFDKLFPMQQDSLDPIVPKGTVFAAPGVKPVQPVSADSVYLHQKDSINIIQSKPDKDNGSNNWAVSGAKTKSGSPILCNDPHLGLNLPSLWYEMQIYTPHFNAYGATFPGAPSIIIGFNDSCAFGFTNAMRDVRDYYEIQFKDNTRKEYWFNGEWKPTTFRYEVIKIKNKPAFIDTVAYTVFGPVMYDQTYDGGRNTGKKSYAVRWKAHDPSNELKIFSKLNYAKNYQDYLEAIKNLHTPGQNCIFAAKNGDIAIWDQGEFPAKWKRQGDFVMPGTDSSYLWQGTIPQQENPYQYNPVRGFVSSANQLPVDPSAYPYYLGGSYPPYRGFIINRYLNQMSNITPDDMKALQTNNYNVFAEIARPVLLKNMDASRLSADQKKYWDLMSSWDLQNDIHEKGATVFVMLIDSLKAAIYGDEYTRLQGEVLWPYESTLIESLIRDSTYKFIDDIRTPEKETLQDRLLVAMKMITPTLQTLDKEGKLEWGAYKGTRIMHLTRIPIFSRMQLPIGGGTNVINATKETHGPSWRMVVHLTPDTEAYGIYPGGQSGNPGSPYYDSFVSDWAAGRYNRLWMMKQEEKKDKRIKGVISFSS